MYLVHRAYICTYYICISGNAFPYSVGKKGETISIEWYEIIRRLYVIRRYVSISEGDIAHFSSRDLNDCVVYVCRVRNPIKTLVDERETLYHRTGKIFLIDLENERR